MNKTELVNRAMRATGDRHPGRFQRHPRHIIANGPIRVQYGQDAVLSIHDGEGGILFIHNARCVQFVHHDGDMDIYGNLEQPRGH